MSGVSAPWTYEPPDAGATDVRAMLIDGIDGDSTFRFGFPRVQLQGDLEFALLRTDAVRLAMEFGVLASVEKWQIVSDLPGFGTGAMVMSEEGEGESEPERQEVAGRGVGGADICLAWKWRSSIATARRGS